MGVSELTRNAVDVLPEGELERKLARGRPLRVKLGIDVTSPDIHVGRAIPLQRMRAFQDQGHTGVLIIGEEGKIFVSRDTILASDAKLLAEPLKPDAVMIYPSRPTNHMQNFIDCVRSRKACSCDIEFGHRVTTAALVASIALKTRSFLEWDAQSEHVMSRRGLTSSGAVEDAAAQPEPRRSGVKNRAA